MKVKLLLSMLLSVTAIFFTSQFTIAKAATDSFTISVKESNGTPIQGVSIRAKIGGYWRAVGSTNSEGQVTSNIPNGTSIIEASYNGTVQSKEVVINDENRDIAFQTTQAKVLVKDTNGKPLSGAAILYSNGTYTYSFGTTGVDGTIERQLFDGTYSVTAKINGTSKESAVAIGGDGIDQTFTASNVDINFSGSILYQAGLYTYNYSKGIALFPGEYTFKFGKTANPYLLYQLTVPDNQVVQKSFAYLSLKDSKGNGVDGATAKYYTNNWFFANGTTNVDGNLLVAIDGLAKKVTLQVWDKGVANSLTENDLTANSFYQFRTKLVTFTLLDSNGTAFPADQFQGQFYGSGWKNFDQNAGDKKQIELLPGKYAFGITYNGAYMQKEQDITLDPSITFQTGLVNVHFAGAPVQYYKGSWKNYSGPVELLPVPHDFYFSKAGYPRTSMSITPIAGASVEKSVAYVRLTTSKNAGIVGASLQYYDGSWKDSELTTDSNGVALLALNGKKSDLSFQIGYLGARQNVRQDISKDGFVDFKTVPVTVNLLNSNGQSIGDGGTVQYYASGWKEFGDANTTKEMLPVSYTVRMTYKGAIQDKALNAGESTVTFNTVKVTINLQNAEGNPINGGNVQYYAGGWHVFGAANTSQEMLPYANYTFRMIYNGYKDQVLNVTSDTVLTFIP